MDPAVVAFVAIGVGTAVIVVGVLVAVFICLSCIIVHQAESVVVERCGKFNRVLNSGLSWLLPCFDTPRSFTWRRTYISSNGKISDETKTLKRIDLRENVFNFMRQEVYTKDTILLDVNSLMYYRIRDVKKAIYEVEDLQGEIVNVAQTQLKEAFGSMTFADAMRSQQKINDHMKSAFGPRFEGWGIKVERMELLDILPKQGRTYEPMKKQMIAERNRRGEFIIAEGNKTAMRLESEGSKQTSLNVGLAQQESTRKKSEGQRDANIELARADRYCLDALAKALRTDSCGQTEYGIAEQYVGLLRSVSLSKSTRVITLPYDTKSLSGIIGRLPYIFGTRQAQDKPTGVTKPQIRVPDELDALN
jgi:regulator of protease activity HflC (stomatin/prohibitin superfamily)